MSSIVPVHTAEAALHTLASRLSHPNVLDPLWLRLTFEDGAVVQGELTGVTDTELFLTDGEEEVVPVTATVTIAVAVPRPGRHLVLALIAIGAGTGSLVLYSLIPGIDVAGTDWPGVFGIVSAIGGGIWALLARSRRFRRWWTRWVVLYEHGV